VNWLHGLVVSAGYGPNKRKPRPSVGPSAGLENTLFLDPKGSLSATTVVLDLGVVTVIEKCLRLC